nr:epididymal secretory protein E1-like [Biomphalaria glabrata]
MKPLIVLCALLAPTSALWKLTDPVDVKDCGSILASNITVDITPCPRLPCPFKKNNFANISISFTAESPIRMATSSVYGIIAGIPVPFPLPDDNACQFMSCPIQKGDKVVYKNGILVDAMFPKISLIMKWELLTGLANILCITVPVSIEG